MPRQSALLRSCLTALLLYALALVAPTSHADPLGLYLGAGVGQANTKIDQASFDEHHAGWKALVGLRPIPLIGAELEYLDFGHPSASPFNAPADAHVRASALSAVLYAPLPVPLLDLYAKAGFSRLQTTASGSRIGVLCVPANPNCALFRFDRTDTRFAFGAGAQVKLSSFALRAEYQRFSSSIGDPSLWSVALTWGF
jgi:opacity protein-like surface antigen